MMGKLRYIIAMLITLAVVQLGSVPAGAQSARQLKGINKQIQQQRQLIKQLSQKEVQLEKELEKFDNRITDKEAEVRKIEKQLNQTKAGLDKAQQERAVIEANLLSYRDALGSRMRSIYMMGDMTYLDLLFSAGNFSDFVDRIFYVQTICGRDEELIGKTQEDQKLLAEKIAQINVKLEEIERYRAAQRIQLGELTALKRDKNDDLATIESNRALAERQEKEMVAQSRLIEQSYRTTVGSGRGYRGKWPGKFAAPCPGPVTSGFGVRVHPISKVRKRHTGVDIGAGYGTRVNSAGDGKVIMTSWNGGYGNCVMVDHGGGRATLYGHLSSITCKSGQDIKKGQEVGKVGSTGYSTGPHLHFEVRINGTPVNPLAVSSL
jgi:peptidoglycan DL-endopeptidase CwlO